MNNFNFTDRLSWLAWRENWRVRYGEASEEIRAIKREMAQIHALHRQWGGISNAKKNKLHELTYKLRMLRPGANKLMIERIEANEYKASLLSSSKMIAA